MTVAVSGDTFYEDLQGFADFTQFVQATHYATLPSDWYIVITDVKNSTKAIHENRYKDVNSIGVASIVALINAVSPLNVPYVFGGDGATVCIPPSKKSQVEAALVATRQMAAQSFDLDLRIGMVPMKAVSAAGEQFLVGKYQPSAHYQQAMFQGGGVAYAESLVKDPNPQNPFQIATDSVEPAGDFSGFECRWNEIPSPHEETISILIKVMTNEDVIRDEIYLEIMDRIIEIYGQAETHCPIRQEQISLATSVQKLAAEIGVQTAFQPSWRRWLYMIKLQFVILLGKWLMAKKVATENVDWGRYKETLVANTDFRKFDELLRMIISGTVVQRQRLREVLEQYRQQGKIVFGIHPAPNALITCIISDYGENHVHFMDGANGGYALAADELKQQLREFKFDGY